MNIMEKSAWWDAQLAEFPTPVCDYCSVPMWVNKRFATPVTSYRTGYQCRICGQEHQLGSDIIRLRASETAS
jgi:hypothetical protein